MHHRFCIRSYAPAVVMAVDCSGGATSGMTEPLGATRAPRFRPTSDEAPLPTPPRARTTRAMRHLLLPLIVAALSAGEVRLDLAGTWSLSAPGEDAAPVPLLVPGDIHSALLAAGRIPDPYWGDHERLPAVQDVGKQDWLAQRRRVQTKSGREVCKRFSITPSFASELVRAFQALTGRRKDNAMTRVWRDEHTIILPSFRTSGIFPQPRPVIS